MISHRAAGLLLCLPFLGGCFLFPPDYQAPTCTISSTTYGTVFEPGAIVPVEFTVSDDDGDVSKVQLTLGDGLVSESLEARTGSFQYSWDSAGQTGMSYEFRVELTDAQGLTGWCSGTVRFNVPLTPKVTTSAVSRLTPFYAEIGGTVTDPGKGSFWDQGIVWGKTPAPTLAGNKTDEDNDKNPFTSHLGDLEQGTTYYVRAYATNSNGTAYGEEVSFTTPAAIFEDGGTLTDFDGNGYRAVRIGDQVWMSENLRARHYRDGAAIPDGTGTGQYANAPYFFKFDDSETNVADYGLLYTAHVARNASLCPAGWHVPSWTEVETLWLYLGGTTAGGKMKETGTAHWEDPNTGATNVSGFSARGHGWRTPIGSYDLRHNAFFWTATASTTVLENMYFQLNTTHGGFIPGSDPEEHAYAVRCVKD